MTLTFLKNPSEMNNAESVRNSHRLDSPTNPLTGNDSFVGEPWFLLQSCCRTMPLSENSNDQRRLTASSLQFFLRLPTISDDFRIAGYAHCHCSMCWHEDCRGRCTKELDSLWPSFGKGMNEQWFEFWRLRIIIRRRQRWIPCGERDTHSLLCSV